MTDLWVVLVLALAVFTQALAGFGSALVAMAFVPSLIGLRAAAPLVAVVAGLVEVSVVIRYRRAVRLAAIWPLWAASLIGAPLGVWLVRLADEAAAQQLLGAVLAGYAVYGLLNLRLPQLAQSAWAYLFGFVAGLLGGAFNTSGPPVVVYGTIRRWPPGEFKGNLSGFFAANSALVVASHALAGSFTPAVGRSLLLALPAVAAGLAVGLMLDRYINPDRFRRVVLVILLITGVRLLLG